MKVKTLEPRSMGERKIVQTLERNWVRVQNLRTRVKGKKRKSQSSVRGLRFKVIAESTSLIL